MGEYYLKMFFEKIKRYVVVTLLMSISTVAYAGGLSNIDKLNELYWAKSYIEVQTGILEESYKYLEDRKSKVDLGVCTKEDIVFHPSLSDEEIVEKVTREAEELERDISDNKKQLDGVENLITVYDKLHEEESSTTQGIITEYKGISNKMSDTHTDGINFDSPLRGNYRLSSPYGNRIHPIFKTTKFHTGIDLAQSEGSTIHAAEAGIVVSTKYTSGYGHTVMLMHRGGYFTLYAHIRNSGYLVEKGDTVEKGDGIALVGSTGFSTGPHVHFEIHKENNRQDPMKYIKLR